MIQVTQAIAIDEDEIKESFIRASGPGGQNVNRVATAVELRFDVDGSPNLPMPVRVRLKRLAGSRMTNTGVLVIKADRFRSQERNRADARDRLVALIARAAIPPTPRLKTRPTKAARERRLKEKERRGQVKKLRNRKPPLD
ncbi:MAG: alternative ribosome rescue aminoacyl-tRNA hydrolase ArfB [Hyphomicrobiaceae bacterium]